MAKRKFAYAYSCYASNSRFFFWFIAEEIKTTPKTLETRPPTTATTTAAKTPTREKPRPFSTKTSPSPSLKTSPYYNTDDEGKVNEVGKLPPIIANSHPEGNEIPDHIRNNINAANIPSHSVEDDRRETFGSKLNIGMSI